VPPDNGKKNRGLLIGAIAAAAVVLIAVVAAVAGGAFNSNPAVAQPTATQTTQRPPPTSTSPSPTPTNTGPSNEEVASAFEDVIVGRGPLTALEGPDGTAEEATCDPSTVSKPTEPTAPWSASCDITYSDNAIMRQTVTIDFDSAGNPIHSSTNAGTQIG
jgi:hypothetical protein